MNWIERIRVVSDRLFDLAGLESLGRNQAPYKLDNEIKRVLAHLAATDGTRTRLLRMLESGVLRVSAEGSGLAPFMQGSDGSIVSKIIFAPGKFLLDFPERCALVTPVWGAQSPDVSVFHTATGVSTTSYDFNDIVDRLVILGAFQENINIYASASAGAKTTPLAAFTVGSAEPQVVHSGDRWLDFENAGSDKDVLIRAWVR